MTLTLSLSDDWQIFDGLETATLRDYLSGSDSLTSGTALTSCVLRRNVTTKEAEASNGKYTTADVVWHVPKSQYSTQPALGGKVVDSSSVSWTILEAQYNVIRNMWRLTTRALAITGGLNQYVTIKKANLTRGTGGQHVITWTDYLTNVRSRLQRNATTVDEKDSRRQPIARYTLFLEENIAMTSFERWQVVDSSSNTYSVLTAEKPAMIGDLMQLHMDDDPSPL